MVFLIEEVESSTGQVCRLHAGDRPVSESGQSDSLTSEVSLLDPPLVFSPVLPVELGSLLVDSRVQVRLREERLNVSQYLAHIMGRAPVGERNSAVRSNVGVKHLIQELH